MRSILIVDDEELIRVVLKKAASEEGYEVSLAECGKDALQLVEKNDFDLVLLDLRLPDIDGLDILKKIKKIDEDSLVIIMTGYASVESAVEAIKIGAYDYIKKPFRPDYIKLILKLASEKIRLSREVKRLIKTQKEDYGFEKIVGRSPQIRAVFSLIKKVIDAGSPNVLITGESGTGKELIARAIHGMGRRAMMPYIEIDCASMPAQLLESELFGYEKGAFTNANQSKPGLLEEADKGSVFFDEIGELDWNLQKKLLRVLEEQSFRRLGGLKKIQVDFQIIAATNKNLESLVSEKKFREDLYYRLKVVPVTLPPLRERDRDVVLIAKYFIDHFNKKFRKNISSLSPSAEDILMRYSWPGNVRELKNIIERITITHNVNEILPEHFPGEILSSITPEDKKFLTKASLTISPDEGIDFTKNIDELVAGARKQMIEQALERCNGNKTKAAQLLRLSRGAFWRELHKLS